MFSKLTAATSLIGSPQAALMVLALLAGCGGGGGGGGGGGSSSGGGGGSPQLESGQFIDGRVQGIAFSSPSSSGVTDANGTFQFGAGENVSFCLGNFQGGACQGFSLGSGRGKFLVQVRDLSSTTRSEQNKLRVLQALDSDNDLTNGITISTAVRNAAQGLVLNFDQDTSVFTSSFSAISGNLFAALGRSPLLPTTTQAQAHANRTLACELTGLYEGTYGGSDTGVFEAIVHPNGLILVRGQSSMVTSERFSGTGSVPVTGGAETFIVGSTTTGANFNGTINATGLSGTWTNVGQSGTFTGQRRAVALPSGASGDVYRGVFSGDDMGSFILAINSNNGIAGQFYSASDNAFGNLSGSRTVTRVGSTTSVSVFGTFPGGTYSGTVRNDSKSVFLDGSWTSQEGATTFRGFAMGCLVGTPGQVPVVPTVVSITPSIGTTSGSPFINSGTSGVTGGSGGTISRAQLDRVTTQVQLFGTCCISGTF